MPAKPTPPKTKPAKGDLRGTLAWHVRKLRTEKGWSQEALAHECGLDRTYVSAIERSIWNLSLSNIERFAKALDVEPWELLKPTTKNGEGPESTRIGSPTEPRE